jgi:lantibiotic modifying enzyme
MDRFFENRLPDYDSSASPLLTNDKLTNERIESAARQLLQLLESKLRSKHEIDESDVSVYTGTSGYALLYYFLFRKTSDEKYLKACQSYASMSLTKRGNGRVTFLCGDVGPLAVTALSQSAAGDLNAAMKSIQQIVAFLPAVLDLNSRLPDELLYGRTGYLCAINFLRQQIPAAGTGLLTDDIVRQVLVSIIESGRRTALQCKSESPLMYFWHDSPYVGAAHGLCGIMYHLLLNDRLLLKEELETLIRPALNYLLTLRFPSGNIRSSCGKDADRLVHWCHGAPGLVYTLTEGFRVFGDGKYLEAALLSGDVIWSRGLLKKGYGLCHGVAGNAYAFLNLFHVTGDQKHLHRAVAFAEFCSEYGSHGCRVADCPWSLFEGLAGIVYFMFDILDPHHARFPAYELDRT